MARMVLRLPKTRLTPRIGAFFMVLALLASGCGQQAKLPPLAPGAVLLAFGDSLTYGTGANENESYEVLGKILRDGSLKADQVHPNARGYRLMAERVYELLKKAGAV